jgi:hypothetical protein
LISTSRDCLAAPPGAQNLRPVIGVFSQDTDTVNGSSTIDPQVKAELSQYRYLIPVSSVSCGPQLPMTRRRLLLDGNEAVASWSESTAVIAERVGGGSPALRSFI